jgi:hypothetical protein
MMATLREQENATPVLLQPSYQGVTLEDHEELQPGIF